MRRKGASLLNVMVFMLFAVMITSQVFFFAKWSADSLAEGRELMMYRLNLDSLVEVAKDALSVAGNGEISHDDSDSNAVKFSEFYERTKAKYRSGTGTSLTKWEAPSEWQVAPYKDTYSLDIFDLDYSFYSEGLNSSTRSEWISTKTSEKIFAPMLPISHDEPTGLQVLSTDGITSVDQTVRVITNRFFLIRAYTQLPSNYYDRKLMYQVLVSRDERLSPHKVDILTFQEVWF